jgi:hypothetical protein
MSETFTAGSTKVPGVTARTMPPEVERGEEAVVARLGDARVGELRQERERLHRVVGQHRFDLEAGRQQIEQRHLMVAAFQIAAVYRHDHAVVLAQPGEIGGLASERQELPPDAQTLGGGG